MRRSIVIGSAALIAFGAGSAGAQEPGNRARAPQSFRDLITPRASTIFQPLPFDSALRGYTAPQPQPRFRPKPRIGFECPMPVAVPDTAKQAKMGVVRPDTTRSNRAMPVAPSRCHNPLGPSR